MRNFSYWFSITLQFNSKRFTIQVTNALKLMTILRDVDYPVLCNGLRHLWKVVFSIGFQWDITAEHTSI